MMLTQAIVASLTGGPSPRSITNSPPSAASLTDLFNGNAYFERSKYLPYASDGTTLLGGGFNEAAPFARPDKSSTTIYLYYRTSIDFPTDSNRGEIALAISTDGGYSFVIQNGGKPIVPVGPNSCDSDSEYAIAPSVVQVGSTFFMVYEGSSSGYFSSNPCGNLGQIHLATSTDGIIWTKRGVIITYDHSQTWENVNVGTPFIGYFNNKYYVFYHGFGIYLDSQFRSKIGMAFTTDILNPSFTYLGPIMDIGNGDLSWDARVNSRASVIDGRDGYYYMTFEGSQDPGFSATSPSDRPCQKGNWGWGIARLPTNQLETTYNWQKYEFNPIRQTYNDGCGNDIPYIFNNRGVITVFQRPGSNIPGAYFDKNVLLTGTDPYMHVFNAQSQCLTNHNIGSNDRDNGWGQTTDIYGQYSTLYGKFLCYGPYQSFGSSSYPTGRYSLFFREEIDDHVNGPLNIVVTLDTTTDSGGTSLYSQTIIRNQFVANWGYQNFEQQFTPLSGKTYEWRTKFWNTAHTVIGYVFLRYLDGGDTTPPTTSLPPLPTYSSSPIQVSWSGSDPDSGIWYYDTAVLDLTTGSGWQRWLSGTSSLSATYNGAACHTYQFAVRANDNAGNLQDFANAAGATTTVLCGLTASTTSSLIPADGVTVSTINIQTQDIAQGRLISLSTSLGTLSSSSCTTGNGGSCTATISSNSAGIATITATSTGYNTATTTVTFSDFTIAASPTPGQNGAWTITVSAAQGFTGTVTLNDTVPTGLSCSAITPSTISLTTSTTTGTSNLSCSSGSVGTYTVTVTGKSGLLSRTTPLTINVDYSISVNPAALGLSPGLTGSSTVTVSSSNGFTGSVTLTVTSYPSGLSCLLGNGAVSVGSSIPTATSSLSCKGSGGDYSVNVSGSSGSTVHSARLIVGVSDFVITTAPIPPLPSGSSWTSPITLTPLGGFSGIVNLTPTAPSGITASVNPSAVSLFAGGTGLYDATLWHFGSNLCCAFLDAQGSTGNGFLYLSTDLTGNGGTGAYWNRFAPAGTSSDVVKTISLQHYDLGLPLNLIPYLSIVYTDGTIQTFALKQSTNSLASESFNLLSAKSINYIQISLQVTIGFVSGTFSEYFSFNYGPSLTVSTSPSTPPGNYAVTTTATSGSLSHTSTVTVSIPDFSLCCSNSWSLPTGGAQLTTGINANSLYGFSGTVTLQLSTTMLGDTTVSLSPTSLTLTPGQLLTSTLYITSGSQTGTYTFTVTGKSGNLVHSLTYTVTILQPSGGSGGGSVASGTLITMADGRKVPVQNIVVGDKLLGYDPTTCRFTVSVVTAIWTVSTDNMLVIHTDRGAPFRTDANPRQTLYVKTTTGFMGWLPVTQIKVGDELFTPDGWIKVTAIDYIPSGHYTMYDIISTMPYFASGYLDPIHKT